jgi:hypothetical protein
MAQGGGGNHAPPACERLPELQRVLLGVEQFLQVRNGASNLVWDEVQMDGPSDHEET